MVYRKLLEREIEMLKKQGCTAEDWEEINVVQVFSGEYIRNVQFGKRIYIGSFNKTYTFPGDVTQHSGIYNATLHNVSIGDDVYINHVKNYIANYIIEAEVIISNIDILVTEQNSTFGNGVQVSVLNEQGGRNVPIYDNLSAQIAYILALYKHDENTSKTLNQLIQNYVEKIISDKGIICKGTKIVNCNKLHNVKIGEYAILEHVRNLSNCSINSGYEASCYLGDDVIAVDSIFSKSSRITEGAMIEKCFVGEGTVLGKQFSAENCLFFANCVGLHGEACSIFGGPYTATLHKSTLLIAGYFSFFNAGSATNQSNHLYKLGPIHQGIIERGAKTASDSYILWPAKIGAFSVIIGRHYKHPDTSNFPFSYLIERQDTTFLSPAANLTSIGTIRDAKKWITRERRKHENKLDFIIFDLFTPYIISKIKKAIDILYQLQAISGVSSDIYSFQSALIKNQSLKNGITVYEAAMYKFVGDALMQRLKGHYFSHRDDVLAKLHPTSTIGEGEWIDLAGLIMPKSEIQKIMQYHLSSLQELHDKLKYAYEQYEAYQYNWTIDFFCKLIKKTFNDLQIADIIECIEKWRDSVIYLDNQLMQDAKKEFALEKMIGFGIDGDKKEQEADFKKVIGEFATHKVVEELQAHQEEKLLMAHELILRLKPLL